MNAINLQPSLKDRIAFLRNLGASESKAQILAKKVVVSEKHETPQNQCNPEDATVKE